MGRQKKYKVTLQREMHPRYFLHRFPFYRARVSMKWLELLNHLVKDKGQVAARRKTLSHYLNKIARLGGYLARAHDPPPGNIVMWRGLSRLTDMAQERHGDGALGALTSAAPPTGLLRSLCCALRRPRFARNASARR
jgi:hypothetical protein